MTVQIKRRIHWGRVAFQIAVALVAAWLAWAGRAIWFPVGIAFVIAVVLDPTVDRLENRGIPRGPATALVFLLFMGLLVGTIVALTPSISDQATEMAEALGKLFPGKGTGDLAPTTRDILNNLTSHQGLRDALADAARSATRSIAQTLQGGSGLALAWAPNLAWFLVVPVLAFYILNDFHRIYAKGILLVPGRHRPLAQTLVAEISALFGKYLRGLTQVCVLLGVSIAALLWAWGNPYWGLLGLIGGLLYAVPVVGSLFTLGLVVLITLVTATPGKALVVGGSLLALTTGLFDQVITPRIIGRQVGLHPILTILALLLGYQVSGVVGMLVAVPLAASVQTVVLHLVPKLGSHLELRPLEELKKAEEETREEHLRVEDETIDEHFHLQGVIENAESSVSTTPTAGAAKAV